LYAVKILDHLKQVLKGEDQCDVEQLLVNYTKLLDDISDTKLDDAAKMTEYKDNFNHRLATYCASMADYDNLQQLKQMRTPTRHTRFFLAFKILEQCTGDCKNKVNARNSMMNKIFMAQAEPKTAADGGTNGLFGLGWGGL
jgi:hypothetical protein